MLGVTASNSTRLGKFIVHLFCTSQCIIHQNPIPKNNHVMLLWTIGNSVFTNKCDWIVQLLNNATPKCSLTNWYTSFCSTTSDNNDKTFVIRHMQIAFISFRPQHMLELQTFYKVLLAIAFKQQMAALHMPVDASWDLPVSICMTLNMLSLSDTQAPCLALVFCAARGVIT